MASVGVAEQMCAGALWRESNSVALFVGIMACVMLMVCFLDRRWRKLQNERERKTCLGKDSHAFELQLVRNLVPSYSAERYQFRGMKVQSEAVDIAFENLGLVLPSGKQVLSGISGSCPRGRLFAILGPSGAGKTSFLNLLSGRASYGKVEGQVSFSGRMEDLKAFRRTVTGFVPQDDIVHEDLTVREQIEFSARLRNEQGATEQQLEGVTEDVLNIMQLLHVQNSIVGCPGARGVSGGERKRVSIGLELAAQPSVLFLDEPTSGLDATSSLAVASSLKTMCSLGMTSIMVVHQPRYSLFTLFDDVLLLGKGGSMVYLGPSLGVKPYFESLGFAMPVNENPADWFMDVISGEVKHPQMPAFTPEFFMKSWEQRGPGTRSEAWRSELLKNGPGCRELSDEDQQALLSRALEEQWDRIDVLGAGSLQEQDFRRLLGACAGGVPDAAVVAHLTEQMAGKTGKEAVAAVHKEHFVAHLCGRGAAAACNQPTPARSRKPSRLTMLTMSWTASLTSQGVVGEQADLESHGTSGSSESDGTSASEEYRRRLPGFAEQLHTLACRRLVQWWRMGRHRALFFAAVSFGAMFLSVMDRFIVPQADWDAVPYVYMHTTLALLLGIFALHVFGHDQLVFWRERAAGVNVLAFHQARVFINGLDIVLMTMLFTFVYYIIRAPCLEYWRFSVPFLCTAYAASSWGYLISTLVPPKHGPFMVALVLFISCGLLGEPNVLSGLISNDSILGYMITGISISRWTIGMSFCYAENRLHPDPPMSKEYFRLELENAVYTAHPGHFSLQFGCWWGPAIATLTLGTVLQAVSYVCLRVRNRRKHA